SDFGNRPPEARQARFVTSPDAFLALWDQTRELARERPNVRLGAGIHSLRAASLDDVRRIVAAIDERVPLPPYDPAEEDAPVPDTPLHIHISEQRREVAACRAKHLGTPIELLGNAVELGPRWSLVHATHATPAELLSIATSGAVVVLCPSTEANLGDGIFPAHDFSKQRGRIAIGSDSGVTLNVAEELRWFEYVQRLATGFRHVMDPRPKFGRPLGEALYERATSAGMQALDQPIGVIAEDCRADLIVLEPFEDEPALDIYLFRSGAWQVRDVIAGGRIVVREGRHVDSEELQRRGAQAVRALLERV
ncbi:MAG TPA: amidohydrolase family protein, partial [Candidatus Baltobacteraceae bacterium]|nr:amidohydrolase family protein [Candidatus Baltobacteraceae bacterium]